MRPKAEKQRPLTSNCPNTVQVLRVPVDTALWITDDVFLFAPSLLFFRASISCCSINHQAGQELVLAPRSNKYLKKIAIFVICRIYFKTVGLLYLVSEYVTRWQGAILHRTVIVITEGDGRRCWLLLCLSGTAGSCRVRLHGTGTRYPSWCKWIQL